MRNWLLIFIAIGLLACGCTPMGMNDAVELEGTRWNLLYINKSTPVHGSRITLEFKDGELGGSAGCNAYFAAYQVSGEQITISQPGATLMACADEGLVAQETAYLAFLPDVKTFSRDGDQLTRVKAEQEQLTFQQIPE